MVDSFEVFAVIASKSHSLSLSPLLEKPHRHFLSLPKNGERERERTSIEREINWENYHTNHSNGRHR